MQNQEVIIPTITVGTRDEFIEKVTHIKDHFDRAQFDLVTKDFADNKTFDDVNFLDEIETTLRFDFHLMTKKPKAYISSALTTDKIDRIIFPYEIDSNRSEIIKSIHSKGKKVGIGLNPETQPEAIKPYIYDLDLILVLAVKPGFYGSEFIPEITKKIEKIKSWYPEKIIVVDGGIKDHNIRSLKEAGADEFCVGSFLYSADIHKQKEKLLEKIKA